MNSQLDIIGSVIIAGMIILNFAFFMGERQQSQITSSNKITQQGDLTDWTSVMRNDILKAGYGVDTFKVLRATPTLFSFRSDMDNNGTVDTITYVYMNPDNQQLFPGTQTGRLYRVVNGRRGQGADIGIVGFTFTYFTISAQQRLVETTYAGDVKAVGVQMRVKSQLETGGECQYARTDFTVNPRNLRK